MRKKYLILIMLLIFAINADAAENLLKNYSFEENSGPGSGRFAEWQTWGGYVYDIHAKENHSGDFAVRFWWEGGIYQQIPAIAESEYQLTAWLLNPKSEPLDPEGTKSAMLELQFVSKNNEILTTNESEPFDCKKEIGKWYQLQVNGIAPPNASFVRAAVTFVGGEGGGIACIDDINLELLGQTEFFKESSKEPYSLDLEGEWLFRKDDNPAWANSDYDDSKWEKIEVPGVWEILDPDYDGFGWYRLHFKIPAETKKEPLFLLFGRIDDADEVYLNGILIGKGGKMPPQFLTAWNRKRQYIITPDIINHGGENILAIRVYDKVGQGGIVGRPAKILNTAGLKSYFKEMEQMGIRLGEPISPQELAEWKKKTKGIAPSRCKTKKLPNGGWTFLLPDGKPFMPVGIEYEPLAIYPQMDWNLIERDLDLIKDDGFNTVTVWCMDFNASGGAGRKLTIDETVKLAELAKKKELFIQFYLNIDRFIHLFPMAELPDGQKQGFDIDYFDPGYREFIRNFAKRLAMALYPYDNVSTIVIWEEKIGLNADFQKDKVIITPFFASKAGKAAFKDWLEKRHETIENLNNKWGTTYPSFEEAVNNSLLDYFAGAADNDHRQYDILEFGQIMLIDFTRDFVNAYKSVDPTMLFQCRNWDLFGPVRAIDPRYSFLDSFGINQYSLGHKGYDITFREEAVKVKLISGIIGKAPYVSNFGFRSRSLDGATHGLVPNEDVKASLAADSWVAFSFIPEVAGTSYFTYFYKGNEGPFGIIKNRKGEPLPIYHTFKSVHSLLAQHNEEIALSDYAEKPKVYIFHGLDAIYDIRQKTWLEHTSMGWDLLEMNLNYGVVTDTAEFDPSIKPVIIANFHAYDKKLDTDIASKLINYCEKGGTLVIGNAFGKYDRYLWPNTQIETALDKLRGIKVSELKRGKVKIIVPNKKYKIPDIEIKDTYYVEGGYETLDPSAEILLEMEISGKRQPALIRKKFGKGTVYYFLFNPYYQEQEGWWDKPESINRASLPVLHFLFSELGIPHDTTFGNKGLDLKAGRINFHEQPIHYFISKEGNIFGTYKDEYGEDKERYSGGVIMSDFISFRGRKINENGWNIKSSKVTSIFGSIDGNGLSYFTLDPVDITIDKNGYEIGQKTEKYKIYNK